MKIHLGSDHAGYLAKTFLIDYLTKAGHQVIDHGTDSEDAADYPKFCINTATAVVAEPGSLGIVLGGSGNGEQIAANKVLGARAALAWSVQTATLAREHNNANLIGIGARMHDQTQLAEIATAFINTPYSQEERHTRRINQITEFERNR